MTAPGDAPASRIEESRFLRACRREPTDTTPIWLMRQAGRYMAEYRRMRERHSILEMIKTPELACEVTLQPIRAFDLDAAIIFADILPPLEGMGFSLDFVKGEGRHPQSGEERADGEATSRAGRGAGLHTEAIWLVRRELDPLAFR
jgi:uroporphyrinogen decarboxylase